MHRRTFLQAATATLVGLPLNAALKREKLNIASDALAKAVESRQVEAATLFVSQRDFTYTRHFGKATSDDAMFLLGSISKPICITALMALFDQGKFGLDDSVQKFLPQFSGEGRDQVTIGHLLTHVSGLPDQLPENNSLRKAHTDLAGFAAAAMRTQLQFAPGTKYQYSSMGILLATNIAEKISGTSILELVDRTVFLPLGMKHSAQGLGQFKLGDMVLSQTEHAAPEAGAGDPSAKAWDWNSLYWRKLGAPWGGTHASAPDLGRFLSEFLYENGTVVKSKTARLMTTNRNQEGLTQRGLGFNVGISAGSTGCSENTFGHTGSTGTIAWCDKATQTICIVLTSLPARATTPHPRDIAANLVASSMK